MSEEKLITNSLRAPKALLFSLDTWAVIVALALALAVKLNFVTGVPW